MPAVRLIGADARIIRPVNRACGEFSPSSFTQAPIRKIPAQFQRNTAPRRCALADRQSFCVPAPSRRIVDRPESFSLAVGSTYLDTERAAADP